MSRTAPCRVSVPVRRATRPSSDVADPVDGVREGQQAAGSAGSRRATPSRDREHRAGQADPVGRRPRVLGTRRGGRGSRPPGPRRIVSPADRPAAGVAPRQRARASPSRSRSTSPTVEPGGVHGHRQQRGLGHPGRGVGLEQVRRAGARRRRGRPGTGRAGPARGARRPRPRPPRARRRRRAGPARSTRSGRRCSGRRSRRPRTAAAPPPPAARAGRRRCRRRSRPPRCR